MNSYWEAMQATEPAIGVLKVADIARLLGVSHPSERISLGIAPTSGADRAFRSVDRRAQRD
jgi:hypothetical protein